MRDPGSTTATRCCSCSPRNRSYETATVTLKQQQRRHTCDAECETATHHSGLTAADDETRQHDVRTVTGVSATYRLPAVEPEPRKPDPGRGDYDLRLRLSRHWQVRIGRTGLRACIPRVRRCGRVRRCSRVRRRCVLVLWRRSRGVVVLGGITGGF